MPIKKQIPVLKNKWILSSKEVGRFRYVNFFYIVQLQSLLFIGAGAGETIPGAGQKRTGSATLDATKVSYTVYWMRGGGTWLLAMDWDMVSMPGLGPVIDIMAGIRLDIIAVGYKKIKR